MHPALRTILKKVRRAPVWSFAILALATILLAHLVLHSQSSQHSVRRDITPPPVRNRPSSSSCDPAFRIEPLVDTLKDGSTKFLLPPCPPSSLGSQATGDPRSAGVERQPVSHWVADLRSALAAQALSGSDSEQQRQQQQGQGQQQQQQHQGRLRKTPGDQSAYCYVAQSSPSSSTGIHRVSLQQWLRDLPSLDDSSFDHNGNTQQPQHPHSQQQQQSPSARRRAALWIHLQEQLYTYMMNPGTVDGNGDAAADGADGGGGVPVFAMLSGLAVTHLELAAQVHAYLVPVGADNAALAADPLLAARVRAALCKATPTAAQRCLTGRPVLLTSAPVAATAKIVLSSLASTTTDDVPLFLSHLVQKIPPPSGLIAFHDVYIAGDPTRDCVLADAVHTPSTEALSITRLTELELREFLRMFDVLWSLDARVGMHPSLTCEKREFFALLRRREVPKKGVVGIPRTDITAATMQAIAQTLGGAPPPNRLAQGGKAQRRRKEDSPPAAAAFNASQLRIDAALLAMSSSTWLAGSVLASPHPPASPFPRRDGNLGANGNSNCDRGGREGSGQPRQRSLALVPQQRARRWAANGVLHDTMSTAEAYEAVAAVLDKGLPAGCDPTHTICNVFFVWTSHRDTWSFLNRAAVESALRTFPLSRAVVVTNTLPVTFFNGLQHGHRVFVWRFAPEIMTLGVPGGRWLRDALRAQGPHLPTHQSDFLRYVALLRFGGLFSDTDLIWVSANPLERVGGQNFLGKIDSRPIMRGCDWCVDKRWYLANGVMRFQRGHQLVLSVLEQIERLKYDPSDRLAIGPHLVTKTFNRLNDPTVFLLEEQVLFPISGPRVLHFTDPLPSSAGVHSLLHSAAVHVFEATYKTAAYVHTSAMQQLLALMPWLQRDPVCECVWQDGGNLCLPYSATTRYSPGVITQTLTRLCIKIKGVHAHIPEEVSAGPIGMDEEQDRRVEKHEPLLQDAVLILQPRHGRVQTLYQGADTRIIVPISGTMPHARALELAQLWYVHGRDYCNDRVSVRVILGNGTVHATGSVEVMSPCYGVAPERRGTLSRGYDSDSFTFSEAEQMLQCTRFSELYEGPDPLLFLPSSYAPLVRRLSNSVTARFAHGYSTLALGDGSVNDNRGSDKRQQTRRCKVGLVVVATGWYYAFLDDFIASAEEYFLPGHEVHYFVFTDNKPFAAGPAGRMHILRQPLYGWPFDSMFRYQSVLRQWHNFEGMDYLFLLDADIAFISPVREEILGQTVGVAQAFSFGLPQRRYPLESNLDSVAYTAPYETACYYAGGIFGGTLSGTLRFLQHTAWLMEYDLIHGVQASHDDEGYLNRFFAWNPPAVVLPASYIYPEPPCDRAWGAGGRRYDTAFPTRILNTGCRKVLGMQPNNGRANKPPDMTPASFLETEMLLRAQPAFLHQWDATAAANNQQGEAEAEAEGAGGTAARCDGAADRREKGRADVKLADVKDPVWFVSCMSTAALRTKQHQQQERARDTSDDEAKVWGGFAANSEWKQSDPAPGWIRSITTTHRMLLKHTPHAFYVLGMEAEAFHEFWAEATSLSMPATMLVELVPRCDSSGALRLLQFVRGEHVVVVEPGLGPGWHMNFGAWRDMLQDPRKQSSTISSNGGDGAGAGPYKDNLWSSADSGNGASGVRIAATCPLRSVSDLKATLGDGPVGQLACGWAGDTTINKRGNVTRVLATDFRAYTCTQQAVGDIANHQAFLAAREPLERALWAATAPADTSQRGQDQARLPGSFVGRVVTQLADARAHVNVAAASCFTGLQPLLNMASYPIELEALYMPSSRTRVVPIVIIVVVVVIAAVVLACMPSLRHYVQAPFRMVSARAASIRHRLTGNRPVFPRGRS